MDSRTVDMIMTHDENVRLKSELADALHNQWACEAKLGSK